ncbi:hypothetical protein GQX74_014799 [Glossina fuscipes]|nr:hypothetical protein GQX74_014799 [Glossina fuscipes]
MYDYPSCNTKLSAVACPQTDGMPLLALDDELKQTFLNGPILCPKKLPSSLNPKFNYRPPQLCETPNRNSRQTETTTPELGEFTTARKGRRSRSRDLLKNTTSSSQTSQSLTSNSTNHVSQGTSFKNNDLCIDITLPLTLFLEATKFLKRIKTLTVLRPSLWSNGNESTFSLEIEFSFIDELIKIATQYEIQFLISMLVLVQAPSATCIRRWQLEGRASRRFKLLDDGDVDDDDEEEFSLLKRRRN